MLPENEIIVLDLAGNHARIACTSPVDISALNALGFQAEGDQLVKAVSGVAERQKLVHELIKLHAVFSVGKDWSPAELLQYYRQQGVVHESYRVISWKGQDNFQIETKN